MMPQTSNNEEVSWLFSTFVRGLSTFAGLISMVFGIFLMFYFNFNCIFIGILLICEGLITTLIESPCLCLFLDFATLPSKFFDKKPFWWKATLYCIFAINPLVSCYYSIPKLIACSMLVLASGSYLILSLGKKASAEEMRAKVIFSEAPTAILVNNEVLDRGISVKNLSQPQPEITIDKPLTY